MNAPLRLPALATLPGLTLKFKELHSENHSVNKSFSPHSCLKSLISSKPLPSENKLFAQVLSLSTWAQTAYPFYTDRGLKRQEEEWIVGVKAQATGWGGGHSGTLKDSTSLDGDTQGNAGVVLLGRRLGGQGVGRQSQK